MKERRIRTVVGLLLLTLLLGNISVKADIIFEPEDAFYKKHTDECVYHARRYTANGPDGYATLYKSPESASVMEKIENGEIVWIDYTYEDKNQVSWGYCETESEKGWLPMEYLALVYDYISFSGQYREQIQEEEGEIDFCNGETIRFWSYPGSESAYDFSIEENATYLPSYNRTFVDEEGRKWGFVGYYYGRMNKWVCLDNPTADFETLYPDGAPERDTTVVSEYTGEKIAPDNSGMTSVIIYSGIAVVIVVAITAGVLVYLKKSKRQIK